MKSLNDVNSLLKEFESKFNLPVMDSVQGSDTWFRLKLGVLSASNASKIVAKKDSETRFTYMSELVAQVCTGIMEEFNSKYCDWGNQHEDAARSSYEFSTGYDMVQLPFAFKDNSFREGCSPDGIVSPTKGVEIKCPFNSSHYIKFLTEDRIKPEYVWQYQYTLRVMGASEWDFVQYDPRMKVSPIKILTVTRDEEKQKAFDDLVPQFIADMDKMLTQIGIKFGDHWSALAKKGDVA